MNHNPNRVYGFTTFIDKAQNAIDYATKNNLKHIEINFSKKQTPLKAFTNDIINSIKISANKNNIDLSFHLPFTENISDVIPMVRRNSIKRLSKYIEVAGKFNAKSITVHPGIFYWFPIENLNRTKALNRLVKGLKQILEVCETSNVKIVLENLVPIPEGNEFYFLGDNIADLKYIFDHINSKYLGFCLDTGHANMGEGAENYIEALGNKLSTIHYHDNLGSEDNHMIISEGSINWETVCQKLIDIDYKGPIISECRDILPHEAAKIFEQKFNGAQAAITTHQ